jgi:S1-C subfamily serine protease
MRSTTKLAAATLCALALCLGAALAGDGEDPVRKKVRDCSVTVCFKNDKGRWEGWGSGTLFQDKKGDSWVLTAAHVIGDPSLDVAVAQVTPHFEKDATADGAEADVVRFDLKRDWALLRVRGRYKGKASPLDGDPPGRDARLLHCGSYNGRLHHSVSDCVVQWVGERKECGQRWDRFAGVIYKGSSGGGVFNQKGEWVGMLTHAESIADGGRGSNVGYYLPVREARRWLQQQGALFVFDHGLPIPKDEELMPVPPMPPAKD